MERIAKISERKTPKSLSASLLDPFSENPSMGKIDRPTPEKKVHWIDEPETTKPAELSVAVVVGFSLEDGELHRTRMERLSVADVRTTIN